MSQSEERAARLVASIRAKAEARRAGRPPVARVSESASGGFLIRVAKSGCRKKCQWSWAVLRPDKTTVESGSEETEQLALAAAAEAVKALEDLGEG